MKGIFFISMFFFNFAKAGVFIEKGMYIETDITIGYGNSRVLAMKDALSVVPAGFKPAVNLNSPAIQCTNDIVWTEKEECRTGKIRYILPISKI